MNNISTNCLYGVYISVIYIFLNPEINEKGEEITGYVKVSEC